MRPPKELYYLSIARAVAARSTCTRAKYGAVIVKNDVIVATGYNGAPRGTVNCDEVGCIKDVLRLPHMVGFEVCPAVHAEENAITNAARSGSSVLGGTLYLYGFDPKTGRAFPPERMVPCVRCRRLIINAGVERVVVPEGEKGWKVFSVDAWREDMREKYVEALRRAEKGEGLESILDLLGKVPLGGGK